MHMEPRLVCFARGAWARIQARIRAYSAIWVDASLLRTLFMHDMYTLFDPHERCEIGRSHQSASSLPCIQALVCGTIDLEQCLGGVGPQNSRVITNRLPVFLSRVGAGLEQVMTHKFLVDLTSSPSIRPRERESKISFPPAVDRDDDFSASGLSLAVGDGPAALRPQPPQIYCAASSD